MKKEQQYKKFSINIFGEKRVGKKHKKMPSIGREDLHTFISYIIGGSKEIDIPKLNHYHRIFIGRDNNGCIEVFFYCVFNNKIPDNNIHILVKSNWSIKDNNQVIFKKNTYPDAKINKKELYSLLLNNLNDITKISTNYNQPSENDIANAINLLEENMDDLNLLV